MTTLVSTIPGGKNFILLLFFKQSFSKNHLANDAWNYVMGNFQFDLSQIPGYKWCEICSIIKEHILQGLLLK